MKLENPIVCFVTLPVLSQSQTYKFGHTCSEHELTELHECLKVEKLLNFSFKGRLIQPKKRTYELSASFKATVIQSCVISGKPIKTIIDEKIERFYSEEQVENKNAENVSLDINSKDVELIHKGLNIGAMAIEALSLAIPDYPRKKNVRFEGVTITTTGLQPIEKNVDNPFVVLKNLPLK